MSSSRRSKGLLSVRGAALAATIALCALGTTGCVRGTVNASESLRWWLFSTFAGSRVCPEMLKRGVPLKLGVTGPASIGRFFPQQCEARIQNDTHTLVVTANGTGYAYLPVTKRVGFYAAIAVEYRPDFRLESDAVYVWGRFNRMLAPPELRLLGVESQVVNLATQTPLGAVSSLLGQAVVSNELGRGFTVVRQSSGDDFALGILTPPAKPPHPFATGANRTVLGTDSVAVHPQAREYLGPFEVPGRNQALTLRAKLAGASSQIVYGVVDKTTGDTWRQGYEMAQPLLAPPGPTQASGSLLMGDSIQSFRLPAGQYYVVVENRAVAPASPLGVAIPFTEPVAYLDYAVEVGDQ